MSTLLLIAGGGATGAVLRYLTGIGTVRLFGTAHIITGTIVVNILGCLLAGITFFWITDPETGIPELQAFFLTGVLSSYTTFSTFALETVQLIRHSGKRIALYLFFQIVVGIGAAMAGGCTSSLGLTGSALFSVAAFAFLGTFFIGAFSARLIWGRNWDG